MTTLVALDIRSEFRVLAEQVRAAGLLRRQPSRSVGRVTLALAVFAASWAGLVLVGNSWAALGIAALLAAVSVQVLFVGHDAGHQQLFNSSRANALVGLVVGDLLTGLSWSWWVPKHNAHHAFPNQIGRDPDIGPGAVPRAVVDQRDGSAWLRRGAYLARLVPLVLLETGMHFSSAKSLATRRGRATRIEWLLLALHAAAYFFAVFWVLSPMRAVAFVVVQQGLFGLYLRLSFAPNHKGMPVLGHDEEMTFAQRQVITSRNVVGSRMTRLALGGLNFQIEHHLFPTMPRANLPRAQAFVEAFCRRSGLDYREEHLLDSYREAVRSLRAAVSPVAKIAYAGRVAEVR